VVNQVNSAVTLPPPLFARELRELREAVLRMAGQVESQIEIALAALRTLDDVGANEVYRDEQVINEACRQIRERCYEVIGGQHPSGPELRSLMAVVHIAIELERMGDYAVRLVKRACVLKGLPRRPMRAELGLMGELASRQVRDILDALIDQDTQRAVEVARRDEAIDQLYRRVFDDLIEELAGDQDPDWALRAVTLTQAAHDVERISDRVTNLAEDIVFLETGRIVELK
jgi:phosphate transport system protein